MQKTVFGPILSRRFGISLGVDLSPVCKQCNFDCLYCELGGAKTTNAMHEIVSLEEILQEVSKALEIHTHLDVLSVTASGEPTLYPYFLEFSSKLKTLAYGKCKTLILSNGSRFGDPKIAEGLQNFDIVKFSLDCVSQICFKKLDRPHKSLKIEEILQGIKSFASCFKGELVGEVLVIKNLNDNLEEMQKIADFMRSIGVSRVDLGSIDRPPAYRVEGVENQVLQELSKAFNGLCVSIPVRNQKEMQRHCLKNKEELLEIIARRPVAEDEFLLLFEEKNLVFIKELLENGEIYLKNIANMKFYTLKP